MIRALFRNAGIHPGKIRATLLGWPQYLKARAKFRREDGALDMPWGREQPMLTEWRETSGSLGAYFFQDQLVARWIYQNKPRRHMDVGSRIDGFIGSLSVFREVEVIDIRPAPGVVEGVKFHQLDLMDELPEEWVAATDSLSCLHTIEHFGLGRYCDPIDPHGHLKGLAQLKRMVVPGGLFYLSAPIGPPRIEFNAHRVFAPQTLIDWFKEGWRIEKFAVIDDDNRVHESVDWLGPEIARHCGCRLGVGIVVARRTA